MEFKICRNGALKIMILYAFAVGSVNGAESQQQWEPVPGQMLFSLIFDSDGKIVGTDSLSWPDGRSAMVQYIKTKGSFYRCIDYHDVSFSETGNFCWKLKKWP